MSNPGPAQWERTLPNDRRIERQQRISAPTNPGEEKPCTSQFATRFDQNYADCRHCNALALRPQRTSSEQATITPPTLTKPTVTTISCQGWPLWPTPVIGDRAAVPKIAASVVTSQFT